MRRIGSRRSPPWTSASKRARPSLSTLKGCLVPLSLLLCPPTHVSPCAQSKKAAPASAQSRPVASGGDMPFLPPPPGTTYRAPFKNVTLLIGRCPRALEKNALQARRSQPPRHLGRPTRVLTSGDSEEAGPMPSYVFAQQHLMRIPNKSNTSYPLPR